MKVVVKVIMVVQKFFYKNSLSVVFLLNKKKAKIFWQKMCILIQIKEKKEKIIVAAILYHLRNKKIYSRSKEKRKTGDRRENLKIIIDEISHDIDIKKYHWRREGIKRCYFCWVC